MELETGHYNTFVIRIWHDKAGGAMRGYIRHVSTEEYAYFAGLEDMGDFITRNLRPLPSQSSTNEKTRIEVVIPTEDLRDIGQNE